ncbi:MAG: DUF433 domain-containing protein [Chitinophagales bacterium]|mgnify:FL=1|nr:DUF433 domain-containing protein [Chitinophagales bacterium]
MLQDIVHTDKEILGGTPVFKGTRVPVKALFDYMETGKTIEQFLEDFPTVKYNQVTRLLNIAHQLVISEKAFDGKAAA